MSTNSSDPSLFEILIKCFSTSANHYNSIAFNLVNIPFILPLCVYILYLGIRQWRRKAKISHTDFFTYNMVVIQLLTILGSVFASLTNVVKSNLIIMLAIYMFFTNSSSLLAFQILTCLERYMAVVHPVTYLRLRSQTWALIRNISCAYVWLQCIIQSVFFATVTDTGFSLGTGLVTIALAFALVLFCNFRVHCVLIGPGPGDGARVSQSKRKSLYTVSAITMSLMLMFGGDLFGTLMFSVLPTGSEQKCAAWSSMFWLTLPSTLVLPMLFLHRNGKMIGLKTSTKHPTK